MTALVDGGDELWGSGFAEPREMLESTKTRKYCWNGCERAGKHLMIDRATMEIDLRVAYAHGKLL